MNDIQNAPPPPPPTSPAPPPPMYPGVPAYPATQTFPKSPGAAGALSLLPGLGHVYLGLYQRGIVYFAIWAFIIAITNSHGHRGPVGLLIPFWMLFVLIDAVRQTRAINATGSPEPTPLLKDSSMRTDGGLTMGILLVLVGVFFLVDRFVTIDLSWLLDWWPLVLIIIGGWQIYLYADQKRKEKEAADEGADQSRSASEL
jgi:hypothetical protein